MEKNIFVNYLKSNDILNSYHLTEEEITILAGHLKMTIASQVQKTIKMVEEVIAIDPTLDWKDILETFTRKTVDFLGAAAASIRIFDPETDRLVAFGSHQYGETGRSKSISIEKTVAGKVLRSGKSCLVPNILLEPAYENKDIVKEYGFHSLIAIPVHIPGFFSSDADIQGIIQIYYKEADKTFDLLEVTNAELLARRISYVLAKKHIMDLQKLNRQKEKIVEKIFIKLSHREGIKMKDVFRMMIPELVNILQIQSCSLFSVSPDRKHVLPELEYPIGQECHEITCRYQIEDHHYLNALVNSTENRGDYEHERVDASYILIKDPIRSRLSDEELKKFSAKYNVNSVLLIPLKAGKEINYFLIFYAKDRRQEFTEQEIDLLTFFGKEIMKALRIEKLDDVLHDFKNPGIAIAGFARRAKKLLEKEDFASAKEKILEYLDIISKETVRMQELAIYPNIEGRERVLDLTEVLKNRFRINEEAVREQRKMNIRLIKERLEPGLHIFCSPFGLERVLDNLLDNATKAIPEEGGDLSIKSYRENGMAVFEICNTGRISQEKIEQIRSGEVKGRGLNIIYRFIQAHHGQLDVFTEDNSTIFRAMLPLTDKEQV